MGSDVLKRGQPVARVAAGVAFPLALLFLALSAYFIYLPSRDTQTALLHVEQTVLTWHRGLTAAAGIILREEPDLSVAEWNHASRRLRSDMARLVGSASAERVAGTNARVTADLARIASLWPEVRDAMIAVDAGLRVDRERALERIRTFYSLGSSFELGLAVLESELRQVLQNQTRGFQLYLGLIIIIAVAALLVVAIGRIRAEIRERLYSATLASMTEGILVTRADGRIVFVNSSLKKYSNMPLHRLRGMNLRDADLAIPGDLLDRNEPHGSGFRTQVWNEMNIMVEKLTVTGDPGRFAGFAYILRDMSDVLSSQREAAAGMKRESVSTLAGGIAHDFNNILTALVGNLEIMQLDGAGRHDVAAQARQTIEQERDLSNSMRTLAGGSFATDEPVDLAMIVHEVVGSQSDRFERSIKQSFTTVFPRTQGNREQLTRALRYIIENACENTPADKPIEVTGRLVPRKDRTFILIAVKDEGSGISPADLQRVFDPFFTRKQSHRGLGLSVAHSICAAHGGSIEVDSAPGSWTEARIWIPVREPSGEEPERIRPSGRRTGKVLLMDDEYSIRLTTGKMLRSIGHEYETAADGSEMLRKYSEARAAGEPFDVVIVDLTVDRGMGGIEAIRKLRALDPNVRAIVSSGYSHDDAMARPRDFGFDGVLPKPYDLRSLRLAIEALL